MIASQIIPFGKSHTSFHSLVNKNTSLVYLFSIQSVPRTFDNEISNHSDVQAQNTVG